MSAKETVARLALGPIFALGLTLVLGLVPVYRLGENLPFIGLMSLIGITILMVAGESVKSFSSMASQEEIREELFRCGAITSSPRCLYRAASAGFVVLMTLIDASVTGFGLWRAITAGSHGRLHVPVGLVFLMSSAFVFPYLVMELRIGYNRGLRAFLDSGIIETLISSLEDRSKDEDEDLTGLNADLAKASAEAAAARASVSRVDSDIVELRSRVERPVYLPPPWLRDFWPSYWVSNDRSLPNPALPIRGRHKFPTPVEPVPSQRTRELRTALLAAETEARAVEAEAYKEARENLRAASAPLPPTVPKRSWPWSWLGRRNRTLPIYPID